MNKPVPVENASAVLDARISELGDWRGKTLAKVREIIHQADPRKGKRNAGPAGRKRAR
jgi:hypothetical protein